MWTVKRQKWKCQDIVTILKNIAFWHNRTLQNKRCFLYVNRTRDCKTKYICFTVSENYAGTCHFGGKFQHKFFGGYFLFLICFREPVFGQKNQLRMRSNASHLNVKDSWTFHRTLPKSHETSLWGKEKMS